MAIRQHSFCNYVQSSLPTKEWNTVIGFFGGGGVEYLAEFISNASKTSSISKQTYKIRDYLCE